VTVHGMLAESAERFAQATALTCGESSWTFADLDAAADVMARELVARGVQPGDRVALLAENSVEYVTAFSASCGPAPAPWP
jgi:acyl-CoA synthetase (AMP-forming)/AMP-acid ligase II